MRRLPRLGIAASVALAAIVPAIAVAQQPAPAKCDDFLSAQREVKGQKVGPQSCMMLETELTYEGRPYKRLDIGLDGTAEGYLAKANEYKEYLTLAPDLVFPQAGNPGPVFFAVAGYERAKGAAMIVVFPKDRSAWNGKMFVTAHGRNTAFKEGSLKAWDKNLDPADATGDLNKYDLLMVEKGYALVKTRRTSIEGLGEIIATLEDGTKVDYAAFNDNAAYIRDFTTVAQSAVAKRLGEAPSRTYLYGHSAGARIARGINYTAGVNRRPDGKPYFDGFLNDDPAAGGWLPVVMKDGKDVLFATEAEKAAFVPQLEIFHQLYNAVWPLKNKPDFTSLSFLDNKRRNALILRDKGLESKYRSYEIRDTSHFGGEDDRRGAKGEVNNLDISKMMDRFIDILDAWADKGVAPPPSRSDLAELGDTNRDGVLDAPALAYPESACPLGVYYPYPTHGAYQTALAAFTGEGLEPTFKDKSFADMNRNGVWDRRETPAQAWRRLGLLKQGEDLTRDKYVACVKAAAEKLEKDGFFSRKTAEAYIEQAAKTELAPKATVVR
jgi:hypothetical protein